MTEPVILYGTQSNGETLPVQVDATGRLVAEGLQGQQGDQGPKGDTGATGPEGPPGEGVPTPYGEEGQMLTIVNGTPTWATYVPPEPPIMWSAYLSSECGWLNNSPTGQFGAFTGNCNEASISKDQGCWLRLIFPYEVEISLLEVQLGQDQERAYEYSLDGTTGGRNTSKNRCDWLPLTQLSGITAPKDSYLRLRSTQHYTYLRGVRLNGEQLLDPAALALTAAFPGIIQRSYESQGGVVPSTDIDPS